MKILIVEDETIKRVTLRDALAKAGHEVKDCEDALQGLKALAGNPFEVVISDIKLPKMDGLTFLKEVKARLPEAYVVMITAYGTVEIAVEAMKRGAYDFVTKPFSSDEMLLILARIAEHKRVVDENIRLRQEIQGRYQFHQLIGKSKPMQEVFDLLAVVAQNDSTVLVQGESGTGKELAANAIHFNSRRKDAPFVKVSCAALSEALLESELFGHIKGAFTGALADKPGRFERAEGGTIFFDEVDDIPLPLQVKLLRVLQEREYERVGDTKPRKVDLRVIAATKSNLQERVKAGAFREDLFYRLNVIPIFLPPLRERKEDIPLLVEHFLKKHAARMGKPFPEVASEVFEAFRAYDWLGNVRELENIVERMLALTRGKSIGYCEVPNEVLAVQTPGALACVDDLLKSGLPLEGMVDEVERRILDWALKKAGGNKSRAAELLKTKRSTLRDKLTRHEMNREDNSESP